MTDTQKSPLTGALVDDEDFEDLQPEVRESIQSIIKKLTTIRVKEEMDRLKQDIQVQLQDQKTQVQILVGHHATQRGSAPTNPLLDNKVHPASVGYPHMPYQGMPYQGHPGGYYPFHADPYYRGRGYYPGHHPAAAGGYYGELRDPYYYPPAYRYVSPERRKYYAYQTGMLVNETGSPPRKLKSGYNTAQTGQRVGPN